MSRIPVLLRINVFNRDGPSSGTAGSKPSKSHECNEGIAARLSLYRGVRVKHCQLVLVILDSHNASSAYSSEKVCYCAVFATAGRAQPGVSNQADML